MIAIDRLATNRSSRVECYMEFLKSIEKSKGDVGIRCVRKIDNIETE